MRPVRHRRYKTIFLMMKNQCRRVVVVWENGELAGMLSMRMLSLRMPSMRDFFRLQGYEAGVVSGQIIKASTAEKPCETSKTPSPKTPSLNRSST